MNVFQRLNGQFTFPSGFKLAVLLLAVPLGGFLIARLALIQIWYPILFAVAILGGLILLAKPDLITLIVLFLIFINAPVVLLRFHRVPYIVSASVPLLLLIPISMSLLFKDGKVVINTVAVFIFLFVGVKVIGTFSAIRLNDSFNDLITTVTEGLVLYLLVTNSIRSMKLVKWSILAVLIAGAFLGSLSIYQQATHTFNKNYGGFAQMSNAAFTTGETDLQGDVMQPRLAGPLGDENYYAQMMLMLVPLGLFLMWNERVFLFRLGYLALTGLVLVGTALTFSRGGALAFSVLVFLMFLLGYIKPYQLFPILLGAVLIIVAFPQYLSRFSSLSEATGAISQQGSTGIESADNSTKSRLTEMGAAALVFADHPLIGVGPGMFKYYYPRYAEAVGIRLHTTFRAAHDLYLDVAADTGALGLGCLLAILGISLYSLSKIRRRYLKTNREVANLATGFFLAILSYMITGVFLSMAYERYIWLVLAMAGAFVQVVNQNLEPGADLTGI